VVAKVKERLTVSKQAIQKFDMEIFHLRKLNKMEVIKHYHVNISNRFAALENLSDSEDINRAWKNIKEIIKISAKESLGLYPLGQENPRLDE
jgi:ribosomal protein S25